MSDYVRSILSEEQEQALVDAIRRQSFIPQVKYEFILKNLWVTLQLSKELRGGSAN